MSTSSFFSGGESPQTTIYEDEAKASADAAAVSAAEAAASAAEAAAGAAQAESVVTGVEASAAAALASENAAAASANSASASANNAATSQTSAAASATAAAASAATAQDIATSSANSATAAAASASSAATSANNAAISANAANTSAYNAQSSETAAAASASSASSSATTATTKAAEASTSATSAAGSATTATIKATEAANSATAASSSASSASTSATNAANSATSASNSASAASTSATNAASAQTAAESARDATLAAFDSFDDRYLGTKTSDPTLDNDGNALVAGALYFNSVDGVMKVYTGTVWTAAYVAGTDVLLKSNNLSDVANAATARSNLVAAKSGSNDDITSITGITDGISSPDYVQFSTTGATPNVGRVMWNDTDGTLEFQLKGGNVNLQIGQEQVIRATNSTGAAIGNGTVVYISGSTGNHVNVVKAQANSETTSSKTLGVVTESIADSKSGFVTTSGLVRDLDTSALTEGAAVWLSATTAGGLTPTRPAAPNHAVLIGWCVKSHASVGVIYVHVMNGYELDELHDVLLTSAANNDVLSYDSTSGLWKNRALATVANTGALSDTTGTLGVTRGGTGTSTQFTAGSVVFAGASGVYSQNNANLFWDDTNNRLGIGTTSPAARLHVTKGSADVARFTNSLTNGGDWEFKIGGGGFIDRTFMLTDKFGGADNVRVAVDSAGNVGIGITSPNAKLEVLGGSLGTTAGNTLNLSYVGGSAYNTARLVTRLVRQSNGTDWTTAALRLQAVVDADNQAYIDMIPAGATYGMAFGTGTGSNPTERMRIDSAGNVGIGTSSPLGFSGYGWLTINGTSLGSIVTLSMNNTEGFRLQYDAGTAMRLNTVANLPMLFQTNNIERMRVDADGPLLIDYKASNGAYKLQVNSQIFATSSTIATSDGRYKENPQPLEGALDLVKALRPVSFNWKVHPVHAFDRAQPTIGFIAQEVQEALAGQPYLNSIVKTNECTITPEEVDPETGEVVKPAVKEDFLGIAEGNLIALLTAALQEANAKIDALETRVAALEARP